MSTGKVVGLSGEWWPATQRRRPTLPTTTLGLLRIGTGSAYTGDCEYCTFSLSLNSTSTPDFDLGQTDVFNGRRATRSRQCGIKFRCLARPPFCLRPSPTKGPAALHELARRSVRIGLKALAGLKWMGHEAEESLKKFGIQVLHCGAKRLLNEVVSRDVDRVGGIHTIRSSILSPGLLVQPLKALLGTRAEVFACGQHGGLAGNR